MQNALKTILLFTLFFVFFGCERKSNNKNSFVLSKNQRVSVFDLFSEVDAIQLETLENCLVSNVSSIVIYDARIYFVDRNNQKVFCFSEEGDFLFQVSRQGNGQGEYNWVSDITIDTDRKRLALLDAPSQRVLFFDLYGNYLETLYIFSEVSLGLNQVSLLSDSLLLFTGLYENDFILYCLKTSAIIERFGGIGEYPPSIFLPIRHKYSFNNDWFVTPTLGNTTYKVSGSSFVPHFTWCFGKDNNTGEQVEKLKENFKRWQSASLSPIYPYIVGKGRFLNNMILSTFETVRYRAACLEFDGNFKNVVVDKKTGQNYVFDNFLEGLIFSPRNICNGYHYHSSLDFRYDVIKNSIESGRWYLLGGVEMKPYDLDFYFNRNHTFYTRDILTERGKEVYDNHDPMHDNPYLVIFRFKE